MKQKISNVLSNTAIGKEKHSSKKARLDLQFIPKTFNFGVEFPESPSDNDSNSDSPLPIATQENTANLALQSCSQDIAFSSTESQFDCLVRSCSGDVVFNNCSINITK